MSVKTVPAHTISWGDKFTLPEEPPARVFTMDRGNGMYLWCSYIDDDGKQHSMSIYIGEPVLPYEGVL